MMFLFQINLENKKNRNGYYKKSRIEIDFSKQFRFTYNYKQFKNTFLKKDYYNKKRIHNDEKCYSHIFHFTSFFI